MASHVQVTILELIEFLLEENEYTMLVSVGIAYDDPPEDIQVGEAWYSLSHALDEIRDRKWMAALEQVV